ncbi:MAG: ATP-dependent DNA helicase RecG [Candidatus Moraniibacteriota bacterium]
MFELETKIEEFLPTRPKQVEKLKKLGIFAVRDFLWHFPNRYDDLSKILNISELKPEEPATVSGEIVKFGLKRSWRKKISIIEIYLQDETGIIRATWFNQKYLIDIFAKHKNLRLSGKIKSDKNGFYISNPTWEIAEKRPNHTGRIVPIYPETKGISSKWLRWQIENIFRHDFEIEDPLDREILKKYHLPSLKKALYDIHFPQSENSYLVAQKRFAFFDMFLLQLRALEIKKIFKEEKAIALKTKKEIEQKFLDSLPFQLTNDQKKAYREIKEDLAKPHPMNRLLNGDVGSGKTIVSVLSALQAATNGFQVAIMAPTEVLAFQHFKNFSKLLSDFNVSVGLLTNTYKMVNINRESVIGQKLSVIKINSKISENKNLKIKSYSSITEKLTRDKILENIKNGATNIVIGTHAIIQKDIRFKNLALIIIDEQHRFGIAQRSYLQQKSSEINDGIKNKIPHFLTMTATPIPRTISMTLLGSLDVSLITEMPKNRKPIITQMVLPTKQNEIYNFIKEEIKKGRQAFVILPLVEESEKLSELKAAISEHERLSRDVFPEFKLGLLHGRMKGKEKEAIMLSFKKREIDILVSTSVIEVGIDIPNATVMIIEEAHRFGLSQLHQFRGRVGRGEHQSYCFLFAKTKTDRLNILEKYTDGFKVAQKDLELRGPGDFIGTRQSGLADSTLQNITNIKMIKYASQEAEKIIATDPTLTKHPALKKALAKMEENIHLE